MRGASTYLYLLMLMNFILKDSKDSNDSFCSLLSLCAVIPGMQLTLGWAQLQLTHFFTCVVASPNSFRYGD